MGGWIRIGQAMSVPVRQHSVWLCGGRGEVPANFPRDSHPVRGWLDQTSQVMTVPVRQHEISRIRLGVELSKRVSAQETFSVITSKAANDYHPKTDQRERVQDIDVLSSQGVVTQADPLRPQRDLWSR